MKNVYIIGTYSTQFKKWPEKSFKDLTRDTYLGVLEDAGFENGNDIEFAWFGNCGMGNWGQMNIRGQVCFTPLVREGLFPERVPIINVEGACATASMAFHGAWKDILSGQTDLSLAIGIEKTFKPDVDPMLMFQAFQQGIDQLDTEEWVRVYREIAEKCGKEFNEDVINHTVFIETYAIQASYHMKKYGTTMEQIAIGASKNHYNGSLNPKAQYRFEVPVEDVLKDRQVIHPFTRSMCAPIGDGGSAALLCSESYYEKLPEAVKKRAVKVCTSILTGGKYRDADEHSLSHVAVQKAYDQVGIMPQDIDVVELHDATSFCEIYQAEMLGFCPLGEGGNYIQSGETMLTGETPVNTSGGLVSKGHPVGATGLSMVYELATQLRGEAGKRQVKDAEFALQENGGGLMGLEEAACSIIILKNNS